MHFAFTYDLRGQPCSRFPSVSKLASVVAGKKFAKSRGIQFFGIHDAPAQGVNALTHDHAQAWAAPGLDRRSCESVSFISERN